MHALSPTDSAFMWLETRNQPMHVAGLNIYTPPKGAGPDYVAKLLADWGKHLVAHAPFNQRPLMKMGLWYWVEDKEFELDYHLRHLALPQPGRIRELLAMVSRLHGNLMDRNRPLWEVYVIEGLPGGRFAIYSKIHHALVDGVTGARMMAQSLSTAPQEHKPPLWAGEFDKHPTARRRAQSKGLLQQITALARAGREILPGIGGGLMDMVRAQLQDTAQAMPFQAPPTPFNVEISGSRRFASQSYSLARLKRIGLASGATVNDVTLAICAGALRKYLEMQKALPKKPLIAMVPVSLHGETDEGGNQISLLLANLATHIKDPVKRLQSIVSSTAEAKKRLSTMPRLQKMAHGATSLSGMGPAMVTGAARKHPLFNVVISNVPGPRETLYLNGAQLDETYPVSIPTHYLALNITITGYGDQLGFGYIACRQSVPALQRMLDFTDQSIEELEAALDLAAPKPPAKRPARKVSPKTA
jgi:diacylglycerol O-acyltransferase / wax synthase